MWIAWLSEKKKKKTLSPPLVVILRSKISNNGGDLRRDEADRRPDLRDADPGPLPGPARAQREVRPSARVAQTSDSPAKMMN